VSRSISEHIRQQLIDRYDPDDILTVLGLDTEELIDYLEELIIENLHKFNYDE